jgi:hypothetical protein
MTVTREAGSSVMNALDMPTQLATVTKLDAQVQYH